MSGHCLCMFLWLVQHCWIRENSLVVVFFLDKNVRIEWLHPAPASALIYLNGKLILKMRFPSINAKEKRTNVKFLGKICWKTFESNFIVILSWRTTSTRSITIPDLFACVFITMFASGFHETLKSRKRTKCIAVLTTYTSSNRKKGK